MTTKAYKKLFSSQDQIFKIVRLEVCLYLIDNLPMYDINTVQIVPVSKHPDDWYLFRVIAKMSNKDSYAVWTCWNETTQCLNFGNYNLSEYNAKDIFYNGI